MENADCTLSLSIEPPLHFTPPVSTIPIAKLLFLGHGELISRCFLLYPGMNYIGRNQSSEIFLPSRNLSRNHACITHQLGFTFLFDCNSHNGSFRYKVPLIPYIRYELINQTEFYLANLQFRFLYPLSLNDIDRFPITNEQLISPPSNLIFTSDEEESSIVNIPKVSKAGLKFLTPSIDSISISPKLEDASESKFGKSTQIILNPPDRTLTIYQKSNLFDSPARPISETQNISNDVLKFDESPSYSCEIQLIYYTIMIYDNLSNRYKHARDCIHQKSIFICNTPIFSLRKDFIDIPYFSMSDRFCHLLNCMNPINREWFRFIILQEKKHRTLSDGLFDDALKIINQENAEIFFSIYNTNTEDLPMDTSSFIEREFSNHNDLSDVESFTSLIVETEPLEGIQIVSKVSNVDFPDDSNNIPDMTLEYSPSKSSLEKSLSKWGTSIEKVPILDNEEHLMKFSQKKNILTINDDSIYHTSCGNINIITPHIMFTYLLDTKYEKMVKTLGGIVESDIMKTTHLITDKIRRTFKFFCCLSRGCEIVSIDWLLKSKKCGRFLDSEEFYLSDKSNEKLYDFNLKNSCILSRKFKLFKGYTFYLTPSILPSPQDMKVIINCSGGEIIENLVLYSAATLFIISCDCDLSFLYQTLEKYPNPFKIFSAEFILTAIFKQTIDVEIFLLEFEKPQAKRECSGSLNFHKRRKKNYF